MLSIETSNPTAGSGEVAFVLYEGKQVVQVLGRARIQGPDPRHDDLATCIERARTLASVRACDVRGVAVSVGPGGFTSVRIAVTTAKFIAEATGALLWGVPSALVVARRATCPAPFGVALASKGDSIFLTVFDTPDKPQGAGLLVTHADNLSHIRALVADSYLPASMRERWPGLAIQAPTFDAVACAECALTLAPTDPAMLVPLYPREPEAVTKWRALHGG